MFNLFTKESSSPTSLPPSPELPKVNESGQKREQITLSWSAPARPFRKRTVEWYRTVAAITVAISIIVFFLKEWLLLAVILAFVFSVYALATIEPENVEHKITSEGLTSAGHSYLWSELKDFYLVDRGDVVLIYIATKLRFPSKLILLLDKKQQEAIKNSLTGYLPFREVPELSFTDKAADWMQKHLPLESPTKH